MRIGLSLREALRSMSRNAIPSFAARPRSSSRSSSAVSIPMVQAATGAANDVRNRVLVNVYLKTDVKAADVTRVRDLLASGRVAHVGKVQYVSKQDALAEQRRKYPEAYYLLGSNPLPDTFRVTPQHPDYALLFRDALAPSTPGGA